MRPAAVLLALLLPALAGCLAAPKATQTVSVRNETGEDLMTAAVRYGSRTIYFANVRRGETRVHTTSGLKAPLEAIIQWTSASGAHALHTVAVRGELLLNRPGRADFVLFANYAQFDR